MDLEMTGVVQEDAEGGRFETRHKYLGGGYNLATVAHNFDNLGLRWCLVGNWVSCSMESADETAERLEMTAVKTGNHTHSADDID